MTHREMSEDLAMAKGTIYVEVPLGSVWGNPHTQKADVMVVRPSYTQFCIDIFEIKTSRADFKKDQKWRGYLEHCHRFYFAVESGVATKNDVPPECGLLIRGDKGWHTAKAAPVREIDVSPEMLLSVIFYRCKYVLNHQNRMHLARWYPHDEKLLLKRMGKEVAKLVAEHRSENVLHRF